MGTVESPKLGFEADIKPLFREKDRQAMRRAFDLWSYTDVVANADGIAAKLSTGTMPCDGAWPKANVERFQEWIAQGTPK
jgi:hypothetical protein